MAARRLHPKEGSGEPEPGKHARVRSHARSTRRKAKGTGKNKTGEREREIAVMAGEAEDGDSERLWLFVGQVPCSMAEEEILAVDRAALVPTTPPSTTTAPPCSRSEGASGSPDDNLDRPATAAEPRPQRRARRRTAPSRQEEGGWAPQGQTPLPWTTRSGSTPPSPLRPLSASSLKKKRGKREKRREGEENAFKKKGEE
uniref:Uncharacterized protein n=1 Tax=Oryza meridionalis TaxID=40149 RepID=A0A0E0F6M3_9ORYZ